MVLRFIAGLLLLVATISLVADLTRWQLGVPGRSAASIADYWRDFAPGTLATAQRAVSDRLAPLVWDPLILLLLERPVWLSIGLMGLACAYLGRERNPIRIYVN